MLSHTSLGTANIQLSRRFYEPVLGQLGLVLKFADENWAAWQHPGFDRPLFIITQPFDGQPASSGNGQMIAFLAATRAIVDECHALALAQGGSCEGAPGLRPHYHAHYYGTYFRDPDGNKLCVCCHEDEDAHAAGTPFRG
jgi:catechol 2,3-dioxygenase-like lactoylglutathione lyase family enzyme